MDGRRRRGGSPDLSYGDPVVVARNRSVILPAIHGYYKEALGALPLEDMPALAPRLLDTGVCFGFADPVTNIIANTLFFLADKDGEPARADPGPNATNKRKRRKKASGEAREVISKIVASDAPSSLKARTIAERSLEGLVTFLTPYFRYLTAGMRCATLSGQGRPPRRRPPHRTRSLLLPE
ncbi:hypothetical protein BAE44_0015586 [Dichanthelium oligosanthes]|uniref:PIR2-like helical domain-containing protein n=1 Tax=Dichanthelium oligosanthes TaxID=888268 RepID=A0A1E5VE26_9POAL|nr:hypothetical protein BAE44_0015586 [Dichanthelium oligosanthes]